MFQLKPRVIPLLTIKDQGLVKTTKFQDARYIGDPINSVRIFNDSEVDELMVLDLSENLESPQFELIESLCTEAFMPLCYGGGVRTYEHIERLFALGVEKVCLNTLAFENPEIIERASMQFGAQSILVCLDVKKNFWGKYEVMFSGGKKKSGLNPLEAAKKMVKMGAGEIVLQSMDHDGMMGGYDLNLISLVSHHIAVPLVVVGGAGNKFHFLEAIRAGASAVGAGSLFVYQGKLKAVLINYPAQKELHELFRKAGSEVL